MLSVESVPALRVLCLMCLALCYGWLSPSGVLFFPLQHSFLISVKSSRHKWIKEGTFSPLVPLTMTPLLSGIVRRRGCTRKLGVGQRTCEGLLTPQVRGQAVRLRALGGFSVYYNYVCVADSSLRSGYYILCPALSCLGWSRFLMAAGFGCSRGGFFASSVG